VPSAAHVHVAVQVLVQVLAQVRLHLLVVLEARLSEGAGTPKEVPEWSTVHVFLLSRHVSSRCINDISR
jgi:hypothetical protein